NSNKVRPSLAATVCATARPIRTEPVAEISGRLRDAASAWPTSGPPMTRLTNPSGRPISRIAEAARAWHAIAVSGVFSEGFHTIGSPHTRPIIAFHVHTATGK